jgi:hypothetical protein
LGVADQDRLTDMLFGTVFPPTSPEAAKAAVVAQMAELAGMRGGALTEDEWAGWRRGILDGLADDRHPEPVFLIVPEVYGLASAGLLGYCAWVGAWQWVWAAGATLAFTAFLGWRLSRGLKAKRRLTLADRLAVVEELAARGLVSPEEASVLRDHIAALVAGRPDAEPRAAADRAADRFRE